MNSPAESPDAEWADAGYFAHQSRLANALRVTWQLVRPPRGHRTIPTRAGALLLVVTLGIGTAAFNTSHNILYIALALLLSSLLLSGVLSWLNFKGCRWRLQTEPHWRAGEPTPVEVQVSNDKQWLPTYALWFRLRASKGEQTALIPQTGRLDPCGARTLEWLYTPVARGREKVVLEGIESRFPFGFLRKSINDAYRREVIVWPPRVTLSFSPRQAREARQSGMWRSRIGSGAELMNVRDYRPGDPLRVVHWKASARQGKLLVRETAEESDAAFCLIVGARRAAWSDEQVEKLCAFAATLAENLFMEGRLGAVILNGADRLPVRRIGDLHGVLSELALLESLDHLPPPPDVRPLIPLTFKPGNGTTVTCWSDGERIGDA